MKHSALAFPCPVSLHMEICAAPDSFLSYTSAPSSPGRSPNTTLNAYFFSVPTSPDSRSRSLPRNPSGHESPGFKFGSLEHPQLQVDVSPHIPIMAYADELFYGGKMLPLKLPPRLQAPLHHSNSTRGGRRTISSASSSPGSRSVRLKIPFRRQNGSLWSGDQFDPFVVALEKVKENDHLPRRSRSLSPLKWGQGLRRSKSMGPNGPAHHGKSPAQAMAVAGEQAEARRERMKRFVWEKRDRLVDKGECRTGLLVNVPHKEASTARNALVRISRGIKSFVKQRPRLFRRRTFELGFHLPKN